MGYQKIKDIKYADIELQGKEYRVLRNGAVISLASGKVLEQRLTPDGYASFTAGKNDCRSTYCTHRIVGKLFLEKPNDANEVEYEVNHLDTNRVNACVENLEYTTHKENVAYSYKLGHYKGQPNEENPNAKLTREDVIEIKQLLAKGTSVAEIARKYQRGWQTINHIKQGNTWTDVTIN